MEYKNFKNKKYRDSFKKMRAHKCILTGHEWQEFDSVGVTGCHITVGRYGRNIKDDRMILPLRQDLHMEMDKNQLHFWMKHFDELPIDRIEKATETLLEKIRREKKDTKETDEELTKEYISIMDIVIQIAKDYYANYVR